MTQDLRAKLAAATRLAEGATTPGERDAAKAAIKRLKKAIKRTGQDRAFEPPPIQAKQSRPPQPTASSNVHFSYTGTQEGFQKAWDEFLNGKRREVPKRAKPVKFPRADNAAYPNAYPRK
jgi:hypothetical protein